MARSARLPDTADQPKENRNDPSDHRPRRNDRAARRRLQRHDPAVVVQYGRPVVERHVVLHHQRRLGQGCRISAGWRARTSIARRSRRPPGAGDKTWHAYLSTQGAGAVNARDRIGKGPWRNAKGVVVANNLDELHGTNNLGKQTSLTEKGDVVNGRGDTPNRHDILTGSRADGTAFPGADDMTCGNYTKSGDGAVMLGHHDRNGTNPDPVANVSWNASHKSAGCGVEALAKTGSAGYLYCFATN
jgi:hypothetical protein